MKINSEWESNKTGSDVENSSLHIPINQEALKEYDLWVKGDCDDLWWYYKDKKNK